MSLETQDQAKRTPTQQIHDALIAQILSENPGLEGSPMLDGDAAELFHQIEAGDPAWESKPEYEAPAQMLSQAELTLKEAKRRLLLELGPILGPEHAVEVYTLIGTSIIDELTTPALTETVRSTEDYNAKAQAIYEIAIAHAFRSHPEGAKLDEWARTSQLAKTIFTLLADILPAMKERAERRMLSVKAKQQAGESAIGSVIESAREGALEI